MTEKKFLGISCYLLILIFILAAGCTGSQGTVPDRDIETNTEVKPASLQAGSSPAAMVTFASVTLPLDQGPVAPLLGRPTDHSVNVNLLSSKNMEIFLQYWSTASPALQETAPVTVKSGLPENIVISGLTPDTTYQYQVCWRGTGDLTDGCSPAYSFHTQRGPGSSFVFAVQADSHLDEKASRELYHQTLANELNGELDFLIDLGDTFMTEKLPEKTAEKILGQYLQQRASFALLGHSVPVYLVLGNHDGESGYALAGKDNNLARLSLQFRKMYFPNPEPNGFYTGNTGQNASLGLKQDYYAWQWGDALFIVLDPFWYTTTKPGGKTDGWAWTLGEDQYLWLKQTLEASPARYKFIFVHHLVGGDSQGRGGIELASLYEWGGMNQDGTWGFDQHRPGWELPIHQLLIANNVTAFFHGHDHLFAKQELDGIVYQAIPQPATMGSPDTGAEYRYITGIMLPSPGYLKVTVSPDTARVDYISSALSDENGSDVKNGAVVYSYSLSPPPAAAEE